MSVCIYWRGGKCVNPKKCENAKCREGVVLCRINTLSDPARK